MRQFNLRNELATPEVKAFEQRMSDKYGRQVALRDIPIKNFVDTTTGLLQTKVASLVMRGATDEGGFWQNLINVVQMTSPKQDYPIISQRDFKVRKGKMPRTGNEQSGGKFRKVSLDTTDDHKIRYVYLEVDEQDVRVRDFDVIERSIYAAGQAFAKNILTEILSHYNSKAGNSQALSTDKRFVAVMKAIGLNKDDGFGCTSIVFESNDFVKAVTEETSGGTMPWLSTNVIGRPLGDDFGPGVVSQSGFVGKFFGQTDTYVVANDTTLAGEILCIDANSAAVFGFAPGGDIQLSQEIHKLTDLIEAKISAKYDFASPDDGSGLTNAVAKVTGASA
jgi:hypothetical protein